MTEDEAKTKWCPAFRGNDLGVNRPNEIEGKLGLCLASACMAWRVLTRTELRHRDGHVVQPREIYVRGNATEHQVPDGGYCGLAGSVQ